MRFAELVLLFWLLSNTAMAADARPQGMQYWDLPTGSRIAYLHYLGGLPKKETPVIFLHGGPGAFIVDHPAVADQFYRSVAKLGFDVYLYDQIGSGHSARLADPRQYTVDRHIRDLEAIRQKIGAERMILIGDSWGATLGANYIAEHPERCAKAIFSGPGAIDGTGARVTTYDDAPMVRAAEAWFASIFSQPRYHAMSDIRSANVLALYRSMPEQELDRQFDAFVQSSMPYLVCDPHKLPADDAVHGMGWWANLMTGVDFGRRKSNPTEKLARTHMPVLILRGGCDYLRWEVAYQYKQAFPNSTLLYVPNAGHAFGYDQPHIYSEAIQAFLLGRPLPVPAYTPPKAPPRVYPRSAPGKTD